MNEAGKEAGFSAETVPATARGLERLINDEFSVRPSDLQLLAEFALLTLKSMDQPAFAKSEVLQRESVKDLQAFATAYAEWKR